VPIVGVILVLDARPASARRERVHVLDEEVDARLELHGEAGVEHVRAGHALVEEARSGPTCSATLVRKRDDVVLHLSLDRVDPLDLEGSAFHTASAASFGTIPSSAMASSACASISNQIRKRASGAQMLLICGRE
jgi:hypothetical protein